MEFFNIGLGELLLIFVIALLVFGPERLPEMIRQAGRVLGQLRAATDDLQRAFMAESQPLRETWDETRREIEGTTKPIQEVKEELQSTVAPLQEARRDLSGSLQAVRQPFKPRSNSAPPASPGAAQAIANGAAEEHHAPPEEAAPVEEVPAVEPGAAEELSGAREDGERVARGEGRDGDL